MHAQLMAAEKSLHWAFEAAADRREQLCYLDFAHAFNSDDHEALWCWLLEVNIPDIDLVQALYARGVRDCEADLPYGNLPRAWTEAG